MRLPCWPPFGSPPALLSRVYAPDLPVAALVGLPVLVAAFGSLPFVVSYLMPDIFAPILLLMIATLSPLPAR